MKRAIFISLLALFAFGTVTVAQDVDPVVPRTEEEVGHQEHAGEDHEPDRGFLAHSPAVKHGTPEPRW